MPPTRDQPLDAFEVHRLQVEENIKRMKRENRLNVTRNSNNKSQIHKIIHNNNKNRVLSGRQVLGDCTNILHQRKYNKDYSSKKSLTETNRKVHSEKVSTTRSTQYRNFQEIPVNPCSNESESLSIFDLVSFIKKDYSKIPIDKLSDRFSTAFNEMVNLGSSGIFFTSNETVSNQAASVITRFLKWFKIHKFNYLIADRNFDNEYLIHISKKYIEEKSITINLNSLLNDYSHIEIPKIGGISLCDSIYQQNYQRTTDDKKVHGLSHQVISCNNLSKFMCAVEVVNTKNLKTKIVILLKTDIGVTISQDDFLTLNDDAVFRHNVCSMLVPVFANWKVFQHSK